MLEELEGDSSQEFDNSVQSQRASPAACYLSLLCSHPRVTHWCAPAHWLPDSEDIGKRQTHSTQLYIENNMWTVVYGSGVEWRIADRQMCLLKIKYVWGKAISHGVPVNYWFGSKRINEEETMGWLPVRMMLCLTGKMIHSCTCCASSPDWPWPYGLLNLECTVARLSLWPYDPMTLSPCPCPVDGNQRIQCLFIYMFKTGPRCFHLLQ